MNLLSNALKFTDHGGEIEVAACQNEDSVIVSVRDTGAGIPGEELSGIFEMYRQLSASQQNRRRGTGLGLVICKKIVEAHGGRIWLESKLGKGSTFYFSLPAIVQGLSPSTLA
jgi:signal transduction histidine kinase